VSSGESEARKREDLLMEIAQQSSSQVNRKHVRLEMEWVQDPLLLAQRVSTALRGGDPAMAVALAREATKQIPGTKFVVAWNRIFGYCFDKGHPKPALRFFNDVSFTYYPSKGGLETSLADLNRDLIDEKARWKAKPPNIHHSPHGAPEILQSSWLQCRTNRGSHL
jgi:transposase InsO family protein